MRLHHTVAIGTLLILLALGLRLFFFQLSVTHIPVDADEAIAALQAKQITRGEWPLLMLAQPYLFPLEAYVAAPFSRWLFHNAFGARLIPALLGLLSVFFMLAILRRWGSFRDTWPGYLLILFPSAYLLTLQTAFALPGYASLLVLTGLVFWLAQIRQDNTRGQFWLGLAAGLGAGLACSGSLLALPLLLAAALLFLSGRSWKDNVVAFIGFALGAGAGLLPFLLARGLYPGAYGAVTHGLSLSQALDRWWSPTLTFTLPAAMGIRPTIFPDDKDTLILAPGLDAAFGIFWVALILAATGVSLYGFFMRWRQTRRPSIIPADAILAMCWLSLLVFLFNYRSHAATYRYLLALVWGLPFVIAWLYARAKTVIRGFLGAAAVLLALINLTATGQLMHRWATPGFGVETLRLYDVQSVISCLQSNALRHAYAAYHTAYRINYLTDEQIICSQPYNERFPGWPLPYKDEVDAAAKAAYVLEPGFGIPPADFEKDCAAMQVAFQKQTCGMYSVYTDFQTARTSPEQHGPGTNLQITVSHFAAAAGALVDGRTTTRWRSHQAQEKGMWIELRLPTDLPVAGLVLDYTGYPYDRARSIAILTRTPTGWQTTAAPIGRNLDPFRILNGHPALGYDRQTITFAPVVTDGLRIEILEPEPGRDWTIGEIEIYTGRP